MNPLHFSYLCNNHFLRRWHSAISRRPSWYRDRRLQFFIKSKFYGSSPILSPLVWHQVSPISFYCHRNRSPLRCPPLLVALDFNWLQKKKKRFLDHILLVPPTETTNPTTEAFDQNAVQFHSSFHFWSTFSFHLAELWSLYFASVYSSIWIRCSLRADKGIEW